MSDAIIALMNFWATLESKDRDGIIPVRDAITALEAEVVNRKEAFEAQWLLQLEHTRKWLEKISVLETENAALKEAQRWIPVSERLPPLDTPVLVQSAAWPDQYTAAVRYDEGDGWLWGQLTGYNATLNRLDSYEFDDDYEYLAWMPLPPAPEKDNG